MSYVEPAEIKSVLAAVDSPTDQDYQGTPAELDDNLIILHIADAQAQVDAALSKIYNVPFEEPPQLVKAITRAIAAYLLDFTYRKSRAYDNQFYPILQRYQWALNQLELLRTNKIILSELTENPQGLAGELYPTTYPTDLGVNYYSRPRWYYGRIV